MVNKIFPTDFNLKSNPVDDDILLIADSVDDELRKITIGSITADIGDGLIVDGSTSSTTTYSSTKIAADNATQNSTISGNYTTLNNAITSNYNTLNTNKLEKNNQLRTGNGAWKVSYNNASGNETELPLGASGTYLKSNGATSAPTFEELSSGYWNFYSKLASDFTVTNNATLQNVTGFTIPVLAGEVWYIELMASTSANNTTGDIIANFVTTGTWDVSTGYYNKVNFSSSGVLETNTDPIQTTTSAFTAGGIVVNNGDTKVRPLKVILHTTILTSGNIKFQIANGSAAAGRESTIKAGSILLARKLA